MTKQTKCQACGITSNHVVNGRCRVTIACFARWAKQQEEIGLTAKVVDRGSRAYLDEQGRRGAANLNR